MSLVWYPAVSIMLIGQASLPSISRSVNQKNSPSDVQRGSFLSELQDIISHKVSLCYGIQENISPQGISIDFWYWLRIKHFLACFFSYFSKLWKCRDGAGALHHNNTILLPSAILLVAIRSRRKLACLLTPASYFRKQSHHFALFVLLLDPPSNVTPFNYKDFIRFPPVTT